MIQFEVPGKPKGKGRPRFSRKSGSAYTPADTASYENLVKVLYLAAGGQLHEGPVHVYIDAHYPIANSKTKKQKDMMRSGEIKPTVLPDADNIIKAVFDGLNNVAFNDDKQVTGLEFRKKYADEPKVIVTIKEV